MYAKYSKTLLGGSLVATFLVSLLFLNSCTDTEDPEVLDTEKPTLSFLSPTANAVLKNTITIQVEALDDNAVTQVEIFVDDVSLKSFAASPYEIEWDTKNIADGTHMLKAVATDEAGNVQTVAISVIVQNKIILITVDAPADFYETAPMSKTWIVLHDKNWNIITAGKVKPGKRLNLVAPSTFADEKFTVTEIAILDKGPGDPVIYAACYLEMSKGMWVAAKTFNTGDNLKPIKFSFINPNGSTQYTASTNAGRYTQSRTTVYTGKTSERSMLITTSPSKLFVRETSNSTNKFFMNSTAHSAGNSYIQDLASVTNAGADNILEKETFELILPSAAAPYIDISLYGLPVQNQFEEAYFIGQFSPVGNKLTMQYPKTSTNTFAGYFSETYMVSEKFMAINLSTEKYDVSTIPVKASLTIISPTTTRLTASGHFDLFSSTFFTDGSVPNFFIIMGPAVTEQEIKIPLLPDSVTNDMSFMKLSSMVLSESTAFSDVTGVDGYFDLVSKTKREQAGFFSPGFLPQRTLYMMEDAIDHSGRKRTLPNNQSCWPEASALQLGNGTLHGPFWLR